MPLSEADQKSIHKFCIRNRDLLEKSETAGCFYCESIFRPSEISDWVDGRQIETGDMRDGITALCPHCGIDSVLPSAAGININPALLKEMHAHWF